MARSFFSIIVLLFTLAATAIAKHGAVVSSSESPVSVNRQCVYSLFVRTGDRPKAGTDAQINVTLADSHGESFVIHNLEKWGLMKTGHRYLEIGNTDFFSVKGKCLTPPVCKMILRSDGSGYSPSWFVEYIKVTQTEALVTCVDSIFTIGKWLGYGLQRGIGHAPYEMVVTLDECNKRIAGHRQRHQIP